MMKETDQPEFTISDSKLIDVVILKDTMREEHRLELERLNNQTPEEGLLECYIKSKEKYTLRINGKIAMMFGVIEDSPRHGCMWALGNDELDAYPFHIANIATITMLGFLDNYDVLYNNIDANYEKGIKFAKFLGATVEGVYLAGIKMNPFYRVTFFSNQGGA